MAAYYGYENRSLVQLVALNSELISGSGNPTAAIYRHFGNLNVQLSNRGDYYFVISSFAQGNLGNNENSRFNYELDSV